MKKVKRLSVISGSLFVVAFVAAIAHCYSGNNIFETIYKWSFISAFCILNFAWLYAIYDLFDTV